MSEEQKAGEPAAEELEKAAAEETPAESVDMQALLEDARAKADEHWDRLVRIQAELENVRRRAEQDVQNAHKFALENFLRELLPVKDSLEMGLNAAQGNDDEPVTKLREGTELTLKMLNGVLEKFGIQEVDPAGEPFNPEHHQAMTMQESADAPPNSVIAVMQKGYLLNDRLVRPAMVVVAKAPAGEAGTTIDEKA